jgi:hypothetical protein
MAATPGSVRNRVVPTVLTGSRYQPVADDCAATLYDLAGRVVAGDADVPAAGRPDVHWLVLLGVPGKLRKDVGYQ